MSSKFSGTMKRFSGAMVQPILYLAVIGILMAISVIFMMDIMPAAISGFATYLFYIFILAGISNLSVILCVGLTTIFAKGKKADAAIISIISFLVFLYANNLWLGNNGMLIEADDLTGTGQALVLGQQVVDMGVFLGILLGCINGWIFNKFSDTQLPDAMRLYGGARFAGLVSILASIALGIVMCYVWPVVSNAISALTGVIASTGYLGLFIYGFLNRFLIPTGLHHLVYMPFMYSAIGGTATIAGETYSGSALIWAAELGNIGTITALDESIKYQVFGFSKIFGSIGAMLAFINTARPERKADVRSMLIPAVLVAVLAGITEPFEFLFLFVSPLLWLVHSVLDGLFQVLIIMFGFRMDFYGGIIEAIPYIIAVPASLTKWYVCFIFGIIAIGVWFICFKFIIEKFDLKTPGREDDFQETGVGAVAGATGVAALGDIKDVVEGLGGASNIVDVENCITRLRVGVRDMSLVDDDKINRFKNSGIVKKDNNVQIIVGMKVDDVCNALNSALGNVE